MAQTVIAGAGVAGLSAAATLAHAGHNVLVLEKNSVPGGRACTSKDKGFLFDKGPSWYWMPEVPEAFFNRYGYSAKDFLKLKRLDPSYKVFLNNRNVEIPADFNSLTILFESIEAGAGRQLQRFMNDAGEKYNISCLLYTSPSPRD